MDQKSLPNPCAYFANGWMHNCQPMLSRVQGNAYSLLPICLQAASLESRLAEAAADQEQLRQRCAQLEAQVSSDSWDG